MAREPTPDLLAAVNEECQRLLNALDDQLRPVAQLKLEGYTSAEIADIMGRVERAIERKLHLIRQLWLRKFGVAGTNTMVNLESTTECQQSAESSAANT